MGCADLCERHDEAPTHHLPAAAEQALLAVHKQCRPLSDSLEAHAERRVCLLHVPHGRVIQACRVLKPLLAPLQDPLVQPTEPRLLVLRQGLTSNTRQTGTVVIVRRRQETAAEPTSALSGMLCEM